MTSGHPGNYTNLTDVTKRDNDIKLPYFSKIDCCIAMAHRDVAIAR